MTIHYNKQSEKNNRRKLRKNSTDAEKLLWEKLRGRKLSGLKFRRQYSISRFVLDFYCPKKRFAIELDGGIHNKKEVRIHDENRDGYIKSFGIKIMRIENDRVLNDIDSVLEYIKKEI
jgi:very-short-patch-repair endonuclease